MVNTFSLFPNYLPWKRVWPFIWTNLNSLHPRMFCAEFGWNWQSGSGEVGENVESLWTDILTVHWAFRSGELKSLYIPHEDLIDFKLRWFYWRLLVNMCSTYYVSLAHFKTTKNFGSRCATCTCILQNCLDKINRKIGLWPF